VNLFYLTFGHFYVISLTKLTQKFQKPVAKEWNPFSVLEIKIGFPNFD